MNLEKLYFLRESLDVTQKELAENLGVDRSIVSHWEKGKVTIPLIHLNKICETYNVSMDYLFNISNEKNYNSKNTKLSKKEIGLRIIEIRKKNNITQKELARILNTTPSTICAYEKVKNLILTSFVYEIAKKYNISMDWICGRK